MRTPERRTFTGCRCRISEPRTARTRLRLVLGIPTRNTDFQIWELTTPSWIAFTFILCLSSRAAQTARDPLIQEILRPSSGPQDVRSLASLARSHLNKRLRIRPLPPLLVKLLG